MYSRTIELRLRIKSKTCLNEVCKMKIGSYCRIEGKGYGFLLPDDADKLCKFFAEHQNKPALEKKSSAS